MGLVSVRARGRAAGPPGVGVGGSIGREPGHRRHAAVGKEAGGACGKTRARRVPRGRGQAHTAGASLDRSRVKQIHARRMHASFMPSY